MKKLLLGIIVLSMTSCSLEIKETVPELKVKDIGESCPLNRITKFSFKGHDYIEFSCSWNSTYSIVHDPECKKCNIRKSSIR